MSKMCEGKQCFDSYGQADKVKRKISRKTAKTKINIYKCQKCQSWHVGGKHASNK